MQTTTANQISRDLTVVNERLEVLRSAIAGAPTHRRLTAWYEDRVAERQALLGQRDRLVAEALECDQK
jgi:hypothetical protein